MKTTNWDPVTVDELKQRKFPTHELKLGNILGEFKDANFFVKKKRPVVSVSISSKDFNAHLAQVMADLNQRTDQRKSGPPLLMP